MAKKTNKPTGRPISDKRKAVLKNAYFSGNIENLKLTKKEQAYTKKAAGGWTRQEKGFKNPETGKFYTHEETKTLKDFLRKTRTDWQDLNKFDRAEIDAGLFGSGQSIPISYQYFQLENKIKENPKARFIAEFETGTEKKVSQGEMMARLLEMQQTAQEQGYTFYSTFSVNRRGEIRVKMYTKEGLKKVRKSGNWQQGNFTNSNEINLLKSDGNTKRKNKATRQKSTRTKRKK
jgi:hypothetical protein